LSTFLLEIGTEELPADFARLALPQLEQRVRRDLSEARLGFASLHCTSTPRRLVVTIEGLEAAAADLEEELKGPPAAQAFKNGVATPAAVGFARRCGVAPEALAVQDTAKGPFVFAKVVQRGLTAPALLERSIPQWIAALQGRRFMRWGQGDSRFSRPVRWLVALLDGQIVPACLAGSDPQVEAGRHSRGHRLISESVLIADAGDYTKAMAQAGVLVERGQRAELIRSAVDHAAAALGSRPDLPESLFAELVDLVESPTLIEGSIEERYLDLPAEVLSTVMRTHQRYVPLYERDASGDPLALVARGELMNRFLCIANGLPQATTTIRRGNERVLKARLADAAFFVEADRAVASIDRRDQLGRVTFAEGLGTVLDRVERLEWCTDVLLKALDLPSATADHARRAAHLCKHDLVSQMVGEFPELQGVMGGKYLLAEGEPRPVALAVLEHYLPRGAADALPGSDAGAVVALAERLELLLSIYAKGERPSGSSDPYGLRRAGNGLLQILWDRGWSIDLQALLARASGHWSDLFPQFELNPQALQHELEELLQQRIVSLLEDEGFDTDLVQAVAGESVARDRVLKDPFDARRRAELLAQLRRSGGLAAVQAVVTRASRLAEKGALPPDVLTPVGAVNPDLFERSSEAAMLAVLQTLEPIVCGSADDRYAALASQLSASADVLAAFFDGDHSVMVMVEDAELRSNRLNLLAVLRNQAMVLADFSRLSG